jgi:hypothetical protein
MLSILCLLLLSAPLARAQEMQIPLDENGRLEVLTAELREELGLFRDVEGFSEARLFQAGDSLYTLEITTQRDGATLRTRRSLTQAEMLALRADVTRRIRVQAPAAGMDQEGRTALITGTTALAMGYYGLALPNAFNIENGNTIAGFWLLSSGLGFVLPYALTSHSRVTPAMATMAIQGGMRGIFDGWLLYGLIKGEGFMDNVAYGGEPYLGIGVAGSLLEFGIGYMIADKADMSAGTASMIAIGGNLGLGLGFETYGLAVGDGEGDVRTMAATVLGVSALGYAAGSAFAHSSHYTAGDATVFTTAALLGAGVPPALASLTESEEARLYLGLSMAGCIGASVIANGFLATRDFSSAQGNYVSLATTAGGLMGAGLGLMAVGESDNGNTILALTAAGATGAFMLMCSSYSDRAAASARSSSWNLQINPAGLAAAFAPGAIRLRAPLPLVGVSARW